MSVPLNVRARRGGAGAGEIILTLVALALSALFTVLFAGDMARALARAFALSPPTFVAQLAFALATIVLLYGNVVYLVTRLGALRRSRVHQPGATGAALQWQPGSAPALAVLVPSYRESPAVVRRTLLSAALQDYPQKQVVLLIDDPPQPADAESAAMLAAMRALPRQIGSLLAPVADEFDRELRSWKLRRSPRPSALELSRLAGLHRRAAAWLEERAGSEAVANHEDRFFREKILLAPAREHGARAAQLDDLACGTGADGELVDGEYRRLAGLFRADLQSFERKQFANLSHEPNKAMNLNSYLCVMGGEFMEKRGVGGRYLVPAQPGELGRRFPDAEFVITLDADSVIVRDYAARLMDFMLAPGHERVAVAQTPYSAYPGAPGPLERIAGATTDVQFFVHQGFTAHNATYWVGANALLRKAALEDIATDFLERGHRLRRFIHDRTVIEDTESSVDLLLHGWTLHNYPERLAYSATPPDFGSLVIQRRRWANGGLLILPKLVNYLVQRRPVPQRLSHAFVGTHYLVSPFAVNVSVLLLLFNPVEDLMASPWLPLAALPYFLAYGRDLVRSGYRFRDIVSVYALNMLLVPVNLAGAGRSLIQAATGRKSPFGRTPKVTDRTATPPAYLLAICGLFLGCAGMAAVDAANGRVLHGVFAGLNAALLGFAFLRFIGLRRAVRDVAAQWRVRPGPAPTAGLEPPPLDEKPAELPAKSH
jgi:cellulose synthase/poly-beta-1,6-N-acetylglucosamine synthase-like glycosyltransferase